MIICTKRTVFAIPGSFMRATLRLMHALGSCPLHFGLITVRQAAINSISDANEINQHVLSN